MAERIPLHSLLRLSHPNPNPPGEQEPRWSAYDICEGELGDICGTFYWYPLEVRRVLGHLTELVSFHFRQTAQFCSLFIDSYHPSLDRDGCWGARMDASVTLRIFTFSNLIYAYHFTVCMNIDMDMR